MPYNSKLLEDTFKKGKSCILFIDKLKN